MPVRMGILHLSVSVLLLVADSNGGTWTHGDGPPLRGTASQLLPSISKGLNNNIPHSSRRELPSTPILESETPSLLNCTLSGFFATQDSLPHTRQKRQVSFSTGSLAHDFIFKAGRGTFDAYVFVGGETKLNRIQNKLKGIKGKLDSNLPVLKSQTSTNIFTGITQLVRDARMRNIQRNFETTQNLITNNILEDHALTAVIQGMISDESKVNKFNVVEIKVTLKEAEHFINLEISKSQTEILQGFELLSDSSDESVIEPLVSKFQNLIIEFKQILNNLQSLPEKNRDIEIERSGGYLEYLQPHTLQETLHGIINEDLAIPSSDSDTTALAMFDLLVSGLQIHANLLSFAVSANVYSAGKALRDRNLEEFNVRMIRVESAISRVKTSMGTSTSEGLLSKVNIVLSKIEHLPFASGSDGLMKILNEKRIEVDQVESDINRLVEGNAKVLKPETLTEELDFSASSVTLPVGQWVTGKQVSYAIQFVSKNGISKVSDWSSSYRIRDKAHPIVHIPATENGMTRLVYRRFNQDKPELVAILTDGKVNSFRDINRDFMSAASGTNSDDAVREVQALLDDGANVNVTFENEMTPLHYAAKYDNVEVMNILISGTADVCAKSLDGEEPIHLAALSGAVEAIEILASKEANVDAQTTLLEFSPLHIAVANNHDLASEALIKVGASVNIRDKNGLSPLHLAVAGNEEALEVLLESDDLNINAVTKSGMTALHLAAEVSNGRIVQRLLRRKDIKVNPIPDSRLSSVHLASIYGNQDALGRMIKHGLVPSVIDKDGSTPLHYAVFYGDLKSVLALIHVDQSLKKVKNNDKKTALDVAVERNRASIVNVLRASIHNISEVIKIELQNMEKDIDIDESHGSQNTYYIPTTNCTNEISEKIIKSSEEICTHVGYVDSYVNLVKFMIPLKKYYDGEDAYTKVFEDYDGDLMIAKDHAKLWRDGDSIVSGIRQTFTLAKEFEPEFSRKYKINQRRIKKIKQDEAKVKKMKSLRLEITEAENSITDTKKALKLAKQPIMISILKGMLTKEQERLDKLKHKLTEDHLIMLELDELAKFLGFVQTEAKEINTKALETKEKIETFMNYLMTDRTAFFRHSNTSKTNLKNLANEVTQKRQALAVIEQERVELKSQIDAKKQRVRSLEDEIEKTRIKQNELREEVRKKTEVAIGTNIAIGVVCGLTIATGFVPLILACLAGLGVSIGVQTSQVVALKGIIDINNEQINTLDSMIDVKNKRVARLSKSIIDGSTASEELRKQRYQLIMIEQDLDTVVSDSDALVRALNKALAGTAVIKDVFDGVTERLENMIKVAKTAGDAASRRNAAYFIYNEISEIECDWKDVYNSVQDLHQCTRNFQILNLDRNNFLP